MFFLFLREFYLILDYFIILAGADNTFSFTELFHTGANEFHCEMCKIVVIYLLFFWDTAS